MTSKDLVRRFYSNIRLFPTLTWIVEAVLVASLAEIAIVVGLITHSVLRGAAAAFAMVLIEIVASFVIVLLISKNASMFARCEQLADRLWKEMRPATEPTTAGFDTEEEEIETGTDFGLENEGDEDEEDEEREA